MSVQKTQRAKEHGDRDNFYERDIAFFSPSHDHINNPGSGILCYACGDHMRPTAKEPPREVTRKDIDEMASLKFCDAIYLRLEWRDVQKKAGRLDLPPVWEWAYEAAARKNKRIAFRIEPSTTTSLYSSSIPEFIKNKIPMIPYECASERNQAKKNGDVREVGPYKKYYPAYDEKYLCYWNRLLELLADRFDSDPVIEWVDLSGYGYWGEWHHRGENPFKNRKEAKRVGIRLVDDHLRAFKKTPAVMMFYRDRAPNGPLDFAAPYALKKGCWIRKDALGGWLFSSSDCRVHENLRKPGTGFVNEEGPILFDEETYQGKLSMKQLFQALLDSGINYLGLGFNPWNAMIAHEQYYDDLFYLAQRVGYRLRPAIVWFGVKKETLEEYLLLGMVNDGVAQAPGIIGIEAFHGQDRVGSACLEPGEPFPGRMAYAKLAFSKSFNTKGKEIEIRMRIRLKGKEYPIMWAVDPSQLKGDKYSLKIMMPWGYKLRWRWLELA